MGTWGSNPMHACSEDPRCPMGLTPRLNGDSLAAQDHTSPDLFCYHCWGGICSWPQKSPLFLRSTLSLLEAKWWSRVPSRPITFLFSTACSWKHCRQKVAKSRLRLFYWYRLCVLFSVSVVSSAPFLFIDLPPVAHLQMLPRITLSLLPWPLAKVFRQGK